MTPQEFPYVVLDLETGKVIGGGSFNQGLFTDPEAVFVRANDIFERHYPGRSIHVQQVEE